MTHRMIVPAHRSGRTRFSTDVIGFLSGTDTMYAGERWSIVTWPAFSASEGTSVTAVAPLPMTTTRLPA